MNQILNPSRPRRRFMLAARLAGAAVLAGGALALAQVALPAESAGRLPAPAADEAAGATHDATAVLAGGCFWGVQGVFEHVRGVKRVLAGYAGGAAATARYERVGGGDTGHAESVRIDYDPAQVSYGQLLQIFFAVAHDPTELDYQGPDHGTQYRSAIFPATPEQHRIAQAYIAQLERAKVFHAPIVTRIEDGKAFYPAEAYHQDFLVRHPAYPYIVINDLPKVAALRQFFPQRYRAEPVLSGVPGA
ncbi:peptide-methionine (S)-S-oxide reductase [Cupriavidus sp. USMAHM13]|uniref:Peptide methionine sulfoxide reductase MsrA n=1 Tax=Cupriavidus malaysiensis TaxID=367825 RepID=A0ABN4TM61_9BURK|nr:peptide-methionine (S)-S-oxide reductase [Cupriavidus sp. USMAHM13]AOZ06038.1 peptide-methionine (S)-S-oxide reductase [Cupriavidus malaysiensis]